MASETVFDDSSTPTLLDVIREHFQPVAWLLVPALRFLASLKVTVVLFSLSIFLVLVGTLAQVDLGMREVMDQYFLPWVAWVDAQVFFPRSWFPTWQGIQGGFPFPGGAAIGAALVINLLAAHLIRFRVQARGGQLVAGLIVLSVGAALTALVIVSGHNQAGLQGEPPFSWSTLWLLVKLGLGAMGLAGLVGAITLPLSSRRRKLEQYLLGVSSLGVGGLDVWLFLAGESAYLGDSGMRILWQLIQGGAAGLVLLAGCMLLFKRRGGIVLIHLGVGLLMFGQYWVAQHDVEEQIRLEEGQMANYAVDIRHTELAIVDSSHPDVEEVVVVPRPLLLQSYRATIVGEAEEFAPGGFGQLQRMRNAIQSWLHRSPHVDEQGVIRHPDLPFDVQVLRYYKNASFRNPAADEVNPATAGSGLQVIAEPVRGSSGTAMSDRVDLASTYVRLLDKDGGDELGVYLASQITAQQNISEPVTVDGKKYDLALRFQRNYKPYSLTLLDVRKDDYLGTNTPRNYSSDVHLVDASRNTDREVRIWMNNPLRYAGETFYQSGYLGPPDIPVETTTLSVVTNSGWMIPYVACMLVATGLLVHFLMVLLRFLERQGRAAVEPAEKAGVTDLPAPKVPRGGKQKKKKPAERVPAGTLDAAAEDNRSLAAIIVPVLVVALFAALFVMAARPPRPSAAGMDLYNFGKLPVIAEGRVKPLDTLARNSLRVISTKETFKGRLEGYELQQQWDEIVAKLHKKWPAVSVEQFNEDRGDVDAVIALLAKETADPKGQIVTYVDKLTTRRYPAVRWLLDVMARPDVAEQHKVFRIDNLDVLETLKLDRRKSHLYSVDEFRERVGEFERQVNQARELDVEQLSTYQRKLLELDQRLRVFMRLTEAFHAPPLPPLPSAEDFQQDRERAQRQGAVFQQAFAAFLRRIDAIQPPLVVPVEAEEGQEGQEGQAGHEWQPYSKAWAMAFLRLQLFGQGPEGAVEHLTKITLAWKNRDVADFNEQVERYHTYLRRNAPEELKSRYAGPGRMSLARVFTNRVIEPLFGNFYSFESYFNSVAPFFFCWWPYLFAFVLAAAAWLGWSAPLNRAAFWLIAFTLVIHSLALAARMYLSDRPPVTNLYSSAVFIGWGGVAIGMILEYFYRIGIGNVVAAVMGFASLVIAHNLAGSGDTFTVLQAVLDTQFWLATHVVCITLGYATTFLAGMIGLEYISRGVFTTLLRQALRRLPRLAYVLRGVGSTRFSAAERQDRARMMYGVICFAMFFSFVGTVLGGLWADDSWGRFWGWDPKENGALIIVLWNALILHARWGNMIKDRGLAVLALGGNIVTAWSWFGVNELGVGLHSYGFTEGVLLALGLFVLSQLAFIAVGLMPKRWWLSQS